MHRFYLSEWRRPVLTGPEAHHCRHVLRLKPGDAVTLFDGRGHEADGAIAGFEREAVLLELRTEGTTAPLLRRITLAQAIPKRSMDLIVQKATELGVTEIVPLVSERTVVQRQGGGGTKVARWRDIALDACKQCGNNWLPAIGDPQPARQFLAVPGAFDLKLIGSLQPDARPLREVVRAAWPTRPASPPTVLVVIGPEGDFTPAELAQAKSAGCLPVSLGPLVLRAETAALFVLSVLHYELS